MAKKLDTSIARECQSRLKCPDVRNILMLRLELLLCHACVIIIDVQNAFILSLLHGYTVKLILILSLLAAHYLAQK